MKSWQISVSEVDAERSARHTGTLYARREDAARMLRAYRDAFPQGGYKLYEIEHGDLPVTKVTEINDGETAAATP